MNPEHTPIFLRKQLPIDVGARVLLRRTDAGLSRRLVARRALVSYKTLERIELGHQLPSPRTLARLAAALNVSLEEFCPIWQEIETSRPTSGMECLGVGFRVLRKRAKISLRRAAIVGGVSVATLSRFERGITAAPRGIATRGGYSNTPILTSLALARLFGFSDATELTSACHEANER